jgi:HAD superfamily hydrolase (TIGR01549 family)
MGPFAAVDGEALVPPDIRAVLFDVDGTLYRQGPLRALMACELTACSLAAGRLDHTWKFARVLTTFRAVREDLRVSKRPEESLEVAQFARTAARMGLDEHLVRLVVEEWMFRRPLKHLRWTRRAGLAQLLRRLAERELLTGVLSDYPSRDKLKALGLADRFSVVLSTTDPEINAFKPHPKGFLCACERWGLSPREVLYVGDRPEVDAIGSTTAGLRSVIVGQRGFGDGARPSAHRRVGTFAELSRALAA